MSIIVSTDQVSPSIMKDIRCILYNRRSGRMYRRNNNTIMLPYATARRCGFRPGGYNIPTVLYNYNISLRDYQIPIVDKSIELLHKNGCVMLQLPPGYGKTIISITLIQRLQLPAIVLVTRRVLLKQWINLVGSNSNIRVITDKAVSIDTIHKVGVLVIDEAHLFTTNRRVNTVLSFAPRYLILLTATPPPPLDEYGKPSFIHSLVYDSIIWEDNHKFHYLTPIFTYIDYNYPLRIDGSVDWANLLNMVSEDIIRNDMILKYIIDNTTVDNKILILTWRKNQAKYLYQRLNDMGYLVDILSGTKNNYHNCKILIGTISKIGVGFDESNLCPNFDGVRINVLILTSTIKSTVLIEQIFGRIFRSDIPKIIVFVDDGLFRSHWHQIREWSISHGGVVKYIDT
jgi:superfamily II DNA or RNA helicase